MHYCIVLLVVVASLLFGIAEPACSTASVKFSCPVAGCKIHAAYVHCDTTKPVQADLGEEGTKSLEIADGTVISFNFALAGRRPEALRGGPYVIQGPNAKFDCKVDENDQSHETGCTCTGCSSQPACRDVKVEYMYAEGAFQATYYKCGEISTTTTNLTRSGGSWTEQRYQATTGSLFVINKVWDSSSTWSKFKSYTIRENAVIRVSLDDFGSECSCDTCPEPRCPVGGSSPRTCCDPR